MITPPRSLVVVVVVVSETCAEANDAETDNAISSSNFITDSFLFSFLTFWGGAIGPLS
jgi:hypothetical protein